MKRKLPLAFVVAAVSMLAAAMFFAWHLIHQPWNAHPPVTMKLVRVQDIVGTWQYGSEYRDGISITFNADGTFRQTASVSDFPQETGRWELDKTNHLHVFGVLMKNRWKWEPESAVRWDVIDSEKRPGQFAILGSTEADPDGIEEFSKVGGAGGGSLP